MGDTRSPRLARSRRPDDENNYYPDGEPNEVLLNEILRYVKFFYTYYDDNRKFSYRTFLY